jgi:hypothetical protein
MRKKWLFIAPFALLGMVAFAALGGLLVHELWNWLLPSLFGWPRIGFWQAFGLLALCRILFGGLGLHGRGPGRFRHRFGSHGEGWTAEEREHFRQRVRERFGFGPATGPTTER